MSVKRLGEPRLSWPAWRANETAFSLVEMVLAIGVVAFCFLTLFGLISVGMNNNRQVREQITGLNLCRQIELDLKATGPTNFISPLYGITIPASGAVSSTTVYDSYNANTVSFGAKTASSQYRFTINLAGPPVTSPNNPVNAQIQATWPPQVVPIAPSPTSNPTNVIGTVSLETTVNRSGS